MTFEKKEYSGYYASFTYKLSGNLFLKFEDNNDIIIKINDITYNVVIEEYKNIIKFVSDKDKRKEILTIMIPKDQINNNFMQGYYTLMEPMDCGQIVIFKNVLEYFRRAVISQYDSIANTNLKCAVTFKKKYSLDSKL